jgi:hypothetical protein
MKTITITQNAFPVYNECGHVVGFDKVESRRYRVTRKELDEIISVENDSILVHLVLPKRKKRNME